MAKLSGVKTLDMVNGEITKISYDGAEYTLTTEEAVKGDILLSLIGRSALNNGAFYTCYATGGPTLIVNDNDMQLRLYHRHDFKVFRKVSADSPTQQNNANGMEKEAYKPQEGDIVVVESLEKWASLGTRLQVGDIGKVGVEGDNGLSVRVLVPGGSTTSVYVDKSEIRKATPAEVEEYEEALVEAKRAKLKAGDYITVESKYYRQDITKGKPYEVLEGRHGFYFLDDAGDSRCAALLDGDFSIVPPSAVKWVKIGRKVNEYRVGDIVRLVNGDGGGLKEYDGIITKIIENDYHTALYRLEKPDFVENTADTWYFAESIELVAPVESTLN